MGWVVNATLRPLYSRERAPLPIVQEAGWIPGPVWKGAENLAPTGIRFPESSALSESLFTTDSVYLFRNRLYHGLGPSLPACPSGDLVLVLGHVFLQVLCFALVGIAALIRRVNFRL